MIIRRKKIKLNNTNYHISVYTYHNGRIKLKYENNKESHDITLNLEDTYLDKGKVFLDPFIKNNGLMKVLRKNRIIRDICGVVNYNYVDIPVATLNMGILRQYDNDGVEKHICEVSQYE